MDLDLARTRLTKERANVERLLAETQEASAADRETDEPEDSADPGQALQAEGVEDAIAGSLTNRLAAIDRALARLDDGTYGVSIRSGDPIPAARLDADPAAELTVEEARSDEDTAR